MDEITKKEKQVLTEHSTLGDVLKHFSSKKQLSVELGLSTRQAVTNWDMKKPLLRVHYMTLRYEKRPDLYQHKKVAA